MVVVVIEMGMSAVASGRESLLLNSCRRSSPVIQGMVKDKTS